MLVVRGTKKLRDRLRGAPIADRDVSTTSLGDWFATALFWRPQVALLVNQRTLLPLFVELAPAATLPDRMPGAIEAILSRHGVDDVFLVTERNAMRDVRIAPTNDRSVVGVMNEFTLHGEYLWKDGLQDLEALSLRLSSLILGPLQHRSGSPDRELAAAVGRSNPLATVIPFPGQPAPATARPNRNASSGHVYQLKVSLLDAEPPIWRRVLVDGGSTLDHIHDVIQAAFGWWNYHLHEFEVEGTRYGIPDPDDSWGDPSHDERRTTLDAIAGEGSSFTYTYDFGDGWDHRVVVEKVLPTAGTPTPACIDGRRACPPEDCGGTWGYRELLEILADPAHPEHDERREWLGRPFDSEAFDPTEFEDNLREARLASDDA